MQENSGSIQGIGSGRIFRDVMAPHADRISQLKLEVIVIGQVTIFSITPGFQRIRCRVEGPLELLGGSL